MTAYLCRNDQSNIVGGSIAIRAVNYEIRLNIVNIWTWTGAGVCKIYRHENSTITGGTTIPIAALRHGAPAASATAKLGVVGSGLTLTGTQRVLGSTYVATGETSSIVGTSVINTYPGQTGQLQSPLTLTITPGSVLRIGPPAGGPIIDYANGVEIYFEELRLTGSS
jgi:hypothetical protein